MGSLENTLQIETKLEKLTESDSFDDEIQMLYVNVRPKFSSTFKKQYDSQEEKTNIALLKDRVEKYHDLTESMSTILNSFEQRLGKLEQTILPVYKITKNLQRQQHNLDSTLQCLETVLSHYDASQEVCNLIHLGPSEGNVHSFLDGLDKLKKAKDYFLNNNPQSVELENVTSLFNTGCETLNNHFKSLLRKHSVPLRPVDLLDLIYMEEDSSNEDYCPSIKQLPATTREELNTIANWLDFNLRREYMQLYADERSDVVFRSLQMLKDHQKSGSWGNEPIKSRYHGRTEAQTRKTTSQRLQHIFERKANKMLLKATQTLSPGVAALKKSGASDTLAAEDFANDSDQELEKYLVLLLGLQRLLVLEKNIINDIVPNSRHGEVFSRLAQNSIDLVIKDADNITQRVLRSISRKEWSAAMGIFSALRHVQILQPDIDRTCDSTQKQQLSGVLNRLSQTGAKALEQFIDMVKGDSGGGMVMSTSTLSYSTNPKDATVHELTSNTIWFLEHLQEHCDIIGGILVNEQPYSSALEGIGTHKQMSVEQKNKALLGIYTKKVLKELNFTIVNKSEQYNDLATKQLFKLNNIHYILKSLQRSNLLDIVRITEIDCERNYHRMIQDLKKAYQNSWSRLLAAISPLDDIPKPINGKIKDKERSIIKERFSNFNKDLEEACKIQRNISVPDVILREGLKRDNSEHLIPQYNAFFDIYSDVQFSKNPEKYVRYRPQEVIEMLNNLFDDTL